MIPFLVTPDMVMSFPEYTSSYKNVRFYFKTEIEANVLGSWTHEITGYMIMKKSSFIVWWLGIELLIELSKAHLPSNKTKQKNNYKPTLPPTPPSGYKPTSRFSCLGSGADGSRNFCYALG